MNLVFGFVGCLLLGGLPAEVVLDRPVPQLAVGQKFESELEQEFTAAWKNVDLRTILKRISDLYQISILLDRRIDPTQVLVVDFKPCTRLEALEQIAEQASAGLSVVGNTVYIGPKPSVAKLRTLVRLRSGEFHPQRGKVRTGRNIDAGKSTTLHWNDLDTPSDLLKQIAEFYRLEIPDQNRLPHDLWAGATLPRVGVSEALSLVLIQFDLTFEWNRDLGGVRIVPIPEVVFVERVYEQRLAKPEIDANRWRTEIPGIATRVQNGRIVVRGTVEQHEALQEFLNPQVRKSRNAKTAPVPLHKRRFKLRLRFTPAAKLFANLERNGVIVRYDKQALATAGIDLNRAINLDIDNATADEFFKAICDPLGLTFAIEGVTVTLTPK